MRFMEWSTIRLTGLGLALCMTLLLAAFQDLYSRNWGLPLDVVVFPIIAAPQDKALRRYVHRLSDADLAPIDRWMSTQARRHGLPNPEPVATRLGPVIDALPPPLNTSDNPLRVLWWALRMRAWSFWHTPDVDGMGMRSVKIYVVYHPPAQRDKQQPHGRGLKKGLIGLVHTVGSAAQTQRNNVVITHEMLHTVGASDKYDEYGAPLWPIGYANPARKPLYPQRAAEIMSGWIPLSRYNAVMAHSLRSSVMGATTAAEINWPVPPPAAALSRR